MTDPSSQDLKALWASQETETDPMTLEQIHALVGKYDRKMRKSALAIPLGTAACALLLGMSWVRSSETDVRIALALTFAGMIVMCVLVTRLVFPQRDPAESAGAFLKRRLQAQLRKARGGWLLYLAPFAPGLAACFVVVFRRSHQVAWAPVPLLTVIGAGLVFVTLRSRSDGRKLKSDLDELDRLMGR